MDADLPELFPLLKVLRNRKVKVELHGDFAGVVPAHSGRRIAIDELLRSCRDGMLPAEVATAVKAWLEITTGNRC